MKKRSAITFIASSVLIVFFAYLLALGLNVGDYQVKSLGSVLKFGLDLKGGVSIEEEIKDKKKLQVDQTYV
jgi:preprotein translocase subunit SecD